MPVAFRINVTKEIIAACKEHGLHDNIDNIGETCPIARAIKHAFPCAWVGTEEIYLLGILAGIKIELPKLAKDFIRYFDLLARETDSSLLIPSFEFDIEIPDEVVEKINIEKILRELRLAHGISSPV